MVAGVSSWGVQCGQQGIPSVYTNLANPTIQAWINNISGGAFPQPTQSSLCPINGGVGFGGGTGGTGGSGVFPIN
ncbi:hypothetical protein RvY_00876 [Ramazzottius varieornatus]|uniref:Peptidase S1 domain-containing protein n=1 Tax=Ramazzottius varieornatus TaxID=947166 RepID=A0A1D1UP35_RAMVA|nr:hypothetical protein RvY_00876 [Ramazzottius varieornatus]